MDDCRGARAVLQRAVTGAPVAAEEVADALRHAAACPDCASLVAAARDVLAMGGPVESALAAGLADPEPIVRERAALRLAEEEQLQPTTLTAIADVAAADPEPRVRAAALAALERVEGRGSIAARVVAWWRGASAQAASDLAAALARLSRATRVPWLGVGSLERLALRSPLRGPRSLRVVGEGVDGRLEEVGHELWLTLSGLPDIWEGVRPVIVVPGAVHEPLPGVRWPGSEPGLVADTPPVSDGALRVRLAEAADPAAAEHEALAEIVLLRGS